MSDWDRFQDWWNGLSDRAGQPHDDWWDAILDTLDIDDGSRKRAIAQMSDFPIVGDVLRMMDKQAYYNDYLRNRNIKWENVKYPATLNYGSSDSVSFLRNTTNFVSKNIERLYRE